MNQTESIRKSFHAADVVEWSSEILGAMFGGATPDNAMMAAAAIWLTPGVAERVTVVQFDSSTSCLIACGASRNGDADVSVGRERGSVCALLNDHDLRSLPGMENIDPQDEVLAWPDCLSAVIIRSSDSFPSASRANSVAGRACRLILSRAGDPTTLFADPQHMEAMAEFAAGAGHEINNPLGSIIGQAQLLLKSEERTDRRQSLETIGSQAWRIRDMIGDAMLFARPPRPEFEPTDLCEAVQDVRRELADKLQAASAELDVRVPNHQLIVDVDASQFRILVSQLIRNAAEAIRATDQPGRIVVELRQELHSVMLIVKDSAGGIPDERIRRHLFNPFFSGRQAGRGLGFGLSHCWQIVRSHRGLLLHEAPCAQENVFRVGLPMKQITE